MADLGMSLGEVHLAQRILGIRQGTGTATKNYWERRQAKDRDTILSLQDKGHVETQGDGWKLTSQGIQQLKQQMGEFSFKQQ